MSEISVVDHRDGSSLPNRSAGLVYVARSEKQFTAIAKVDREHRTHKTKDGQYIVVIKRQDVRERQEG